MDCNHLEVGILDYHMMRPVLLLFFVLKSRFFRHFSNFKLKKLLPNGKIGPELGENIPGVRAKWAGS